MVKVYPSSLRPREGFTDLRAALSPETRPSQGSSLSQYSRRRPLKLVSSSLWPSFQVCPIGKRRGSSLPASQADGIDENVYISII